ncbi:lipoprotein [Ramlibacter solisilvae]|uniref:Lipoprotein n=1 Tax=Ramlibacter tataouinensis TaxID=94132 RepID=A0A127JW27_9BURK|nr:hypothetical protein [Ramlibacter tataouinensis]AMO24216.1 lipoprotein [Ramlibacter tataouinensis]
MTKRRIVWVVWPVAAVAALAACSEKPQTMGGSNSKQDAAAFQGTGMPYVATGWKPGDKTSWEQQLKTRAQMGQNDYNKVP